MLIKGIKSISDVITNSSSEVYVMHEGDAKYYYNLENTDDCVDIAKIDLEWLKNDGLCEFKMVCDVCDIDKTLLNYTDEYGVYIDYSNDDTWRYPTQEDWLTFIEINFKTIEEKILKQNYYWVDIEDHFENAYDVSSDARGDSVWTDYRH